MYPFLQGCIFANGSMFPLCSCLFSELFVKILTNPIFLSLDFFLLSCYLLDQLLFFSLLLLVVDAFGDFIQLNFGFLNGSEPDLFISGKTSKNTNLMGVKHVRLHRKPACIYELLHRGIES